MSDSIRLADHIWKDGESLIGRLEQLGRSGIQPGVFYQEVVDGMLAVSGGQSVVFSHQKDFSQRSNEAERSSEDEFELARTGIFVASAAPSAFIESCQDACPSPIAKWDSVTHLSANQRVAEKAVIGLEIRFEQPSDAKAARALCELVEAVLQLSSSVYLRDKYDQLQRSSNRRVEQNRWKSQLYSGVTLRESFASIAEAVSETVQTDRVGVLRKQNQHFELVATSTQPMVDRRAQQTRLIENLVANAMSIARTFTFAVGSGVEVAESIRPSLDRYLDASGVKSLHIELVVDEDESSCAALMTESFRSDSGDSKKQFDAIRDESFHAVRLAVQRDKVTWSQIGLTGAANAIAQVSTSRKALAFLAATVLAFALLYFVPAELKLPVQGRLVPAERQRLFAPVDSTISNVLVSNGQKVQKGDVLIELTSSKLDLQQQQIAGELATAKTQLGVVMAIRSDANAKRTNAASDQQVLNTRIQGLVKQLELIVQRKKKLSILSPMDGTIDRWDLEHSLTAKPVVHGEYLVDVVASEKGWTVELDIPEHESGYVIDRQSSQSCEVDVRLRSGPGHEFSATLDTVADVAMLSDTGDPIVRARVSVTDQNSDAFRSGATVQAKIHCGKRSLGAVWFRGVIQWARQHGWL